MSYLSKCSFSEPITQFQNYRTLYSRCRVFFLSTMFTENDENFIVFLEKKITFYTESVVPIRALRA